MFNLGMPEIVIILVIALLIFGPKKLPEIGKSLGQALRELRKTTAEITNSIDNELYDTTHKGESK